MHLKMPSPNCRPFCLDLNVLICILSLSTHIHFTIRTINNAYYIHREPSICSLGRVHTHHTKNPTLRKITIWKVNWLEIMWWQRLVFEYIDTKCNLVLGALDTLFFIFSLVKFYCFTNSYVPNIEAKSVVLELTTRGSEYCYWFLFCPGRYSKFSE